MEDWTTTISHITFEMLINLQLWSMLVSWSMMFCCFEILYGYGEAEYESETYFSFYLDYVVTLIYTVNLFVYVLTMIRIFLIFKYSYCITEFMHLTLTLFCIYLVWLLFIISIYAELVETRSNVRIELILCWVTYLVTAMFVYNYIEFFYYLLYWHE